MLKKIIVTSAILATSSSFAFADAVPYVGANLGLNSNSFNFKNAAGNTNTHFNSTGLTGGAFAGLGGIVSQNIYLGAEAFVNGGSMSTATKTTDNLGTTDKIKMTYTYGLDFVPGYMVTENIKVYAKVGIVRSRFKLTQTPVQPSSLGSGSTYNTVTGGQLGLGVQTAVARNVDVRGEFVHTSYSSFTAYGNNIKPRNNQVNLGLVYNFD